MASRKNRRPLTLLKGYSLFLNGFSSEDILNAGISEAELGKIRSFNNSISQNKHYITASCELSIDIKLAKRLMKLYREKEANLPLSYPPRRTSFTGAFRLLVDGLSREEILLQGCSDQEIYKAKKFLEFVPHADKMLIATIAQQFEVTRGAVERMLKIYRQKEAERTTGEVNEHMSQLQLNGVMI